MIIDEIQAEHLCDVSLECYCYVSPYNVQLFAVCCTCVQLLCTFTLDNSHKWNEEQ
jgi:hypothetical protein